MTFSSTPFFVVDASVWVARLVPQDEFHETVKGWMKRWHAEGRQLISPTLLLAEVGGAIARRTGDPALGEKAITQLERLPGLRLVEMDHELVHAAATLAAQLGLRGADSLYVATAQQLRLPLVTFDVEQRERAKAVVTISRMPHSSKKV